MRLIDADALSKKVSSTTLFIKDAGVFQQMIVDAPTIEPSGEREQPEYCIAYGKGVCGYPIDACCECPKHEYYKEFEKESKPSGDLISRADAIKGIQDGYCSCVSDCIDEINKLQSIGTDCTDFIHWISKVVADEELWELNAVGYGEIICRKLVKIGALATTEKPPYYYVPSVSVKPNCKECKRHNNTTFFMDDEDEPSDLISRADLLWEIEQLKQSPWYNDDTNHSKVTRIDAVSVIENLCIKRMPSVSAERVGEWTAEIGYEGEVIYYECSNCKEAFSLLEGTPEENRYNYCPNCGARMVTK